MEVNELSSWVVDDRMVLVGRRDSGDGLVRWVVVSSSDGLDWEIREAPTRIRALYAGNVIDGRLWFIARVRGDAEGSSDTRQLVSTLTGETWEFLGPAANMGARDGAGFLSRVDGQWIASVYRLTPGEPFATIDGEVRTSIDGIDWTISRTPYADPMTGYTDAALLGDSIVVRGSRREFNGEAKDFNFFMRSVDGRSWSTADFQPDGNGGIADYLCRPEGCVAVGTGTTLDNDTDYPRAWTSEDGLQWIEGTAEMPPARFNAGMDDVLLTSRGYLAQGGPGGDAWLSSDGRTWRHVQVMERGEANPSWLAVIGDRILAVQTDGRGEGRLEVWIGSVAALDW